MSWQNLLSCTNASTNYKLIFKKMLQYSPNILLHHQFCLLEKEYKQFSTYVCLKN